MFVYSSEFEQKRFQFHLPIKTQKIELTYRDVIYVKVNGYFGNKASIGMGEIAPLPGLSKETIEECLDLCALINENFPMRIHENFFKNKWFFETISIPSVRFGFEQAIFNLLLPFISKETLLGQCFQPFINANFLLTKNDKTLIQQIEKQNIACVKVKIQSTINETISILKSLSNNVTFRIDANGLWNDNEIEEWLNVLASHQIEYIEDISLDKNKIIFLQKQTSIPLAVDEPIRSLEDARFFLQNGIKFLIVKPTLLGSIIVTHDIIKLSESYNAKTIITHSFESPLAIRALSLLAQSTNHNFPHGLHFAYL